MQVQVFRSAAPSGAALAWIRVTGELDVATVSILAAALAEAGDTPRAVIDLRRVSFMDLASLRLLVAERQRGLPRRAGVE
jgi:anti-anti-sigma factor